MVLVGVAVAAPSRPSWFMPIRDSRAIEVPEAARWRWLEVGSGKWEGESAETDRRIAKIARTSVDSAPFFDTNYTLGTVDVLHTESYVKT